MSLFLYLYIYPYTLIFSMSIYRSCNLYIYILVSMMQKNLDIFGFTQKAVPSLANPKDDVVSLIHVLEVDAVSARDAAQQRLLEAFASHGGRGVVLPPKKGRNVQFHQ